MCDYRHIAQVIDSQGHGSELPVPWCYLSVPAWSWLPVKVDIATLSSICESISIGNCGVLHHMFETVLMVCAQVATAATFSAAWLEALRMMLAGLEQPQGGVAIPLGWTADIIPFPSPSGHQIFAMGPPFTGCSDSS